MECKLESFWKPFKFIKVLIGTLWNVNLENAAVIRVMDAVLIGTLWNVNTENLKRRIEQTGF